MNEILEKIDYIDALGVSCKKEKLIGEGTQGQVYTISCGQEKLALKWYFPNMATDDQKNIVNNLIEHQISDTKFLWPMGIVYDDRIAGFGYIMPYKDEKYVSFSKWMNRAVDPSFRSLLTACYNIANNFYILHSAGLCYRDISLNNIFFDPETGEIQIGDTDNIIINGQKIGNIAGTPKFMAPEIVKGDALPSRQTDLFSLAVLLFYINFLSSPLEGMNESRIKNMDLAALKKLYGDEPIFIFDPENDSNRPDPRYHENAVIFWKIYPKFFKDLFIEAFTKGISDPVNGRVRESQWRSGIVQMRDLIFYCSYCNQQNFYDPEEKNNLSNGISNDRCYSCGQIMIKPFHIQIKDKIVMLNSDTKLYPHHIDPQKLYDFNNPIAEVTNHPKYPQIWGLKNLSSEKWTMSSKDGKIYDVDYGKNVAIKLDTKIEFGKATGEIKLSQ